MLELNCYRNSKFFKLVDVQLRPPIIIEAKTHSLFARLAAGLVSMRFCGEYVISAHIYYSVYLCSKN